MLKSTPILLAALLAAPLPALAQDSPEILEIRDVWGACSKMLETTPDAWNGWRRDFGNGYADSFQFHEGGDDAVAVLEQRFIIDGIAIQDDTSCYRRNGTLAFIFSRMTSPNMAIGFEGPLITREGRIYYNPDGKVVRILGRIVEEGEEVAAMDNEDFSLARGCHATSPHMTTDDVRVHLGAELGDIEGNRPVFEPTSFAWCNDPMLNE